MTPADANDPRPSQPPSETAAGSDQPSELGAALGSTEAARGPSGEEQAPASSAPTAPSEAHSINNTTGDRPGAGSRRKSFLRRFFLLEDELRRAQTLSFSSKDPGFSQYQLAQHAFRGARTLHDQGHHADAPLLLARTASLLAASAAALREGIATDAETRDGAAGWVRFGQTAAFKAVLAGFAESHLQAVRLTIEQEESSLVGLGHDKRQLRLAAMLRFSGAIVAELEQQAIGPASVRFRRGRRLAGAGVLVVALIAGGVALLAGRADATENLALGKPVTVSSNHDKRRFPASGLTDGNKRDIGMHTKSERNAWAQIDLGAPLLISTVVVTNRDRDQSRAVPLLIQVSTDAENWIEFARQHSSFNTWTATGSATARYVRLLNPKRSKLHLNEVEVY